MLWCKQNTTNYVPNAAATKLAAAPPAPATRAASPSVGGSNSSKIRSIGSRSSSNTSSISGGGGTVPAAAAAAAVYASWGCSSGDPTNETLAFSKVQAMHQEVGSVINDVADLPDKIIALGEALLGW